MDGITELDLHRWSEALAAIARNGLGFSDNLYERERYEEVLAVAADMRAAALRRTIDPSWLLTEWMGQVTPGVPGYVTPKVAVGAAVGDDEGRLLLIQRSDSGVWLYPTGWADIGYSPAEVAEKEVREETGIEASAEALVAVFDGLRRGFSTIPLYSLLFRLRAHGGVPTPHPLECSDVGWFGRDELPEPLAGGGAWVDLAFDAISGDPGPTYFDPPRSEVWADPSDDAPQATGSEGNASMVTDSADLGGGATPSSQTGEPT